MNIIIIEIPKVLIHEPDSYLVESDDGKGQIDAVGKVFDLSWDENDPDLPFQYIIAVRNTEENNWKLYSNVTSLYCNNCDTD